MSGDPSLCHVIADCERALGRPQRAVDVARSAQARAVGAPWRIELAIVEAGARRDLGQYDAALAALHAAGVRDDVIEEWTPRLWYAYADTLAAAGRADEAKDWFLAAARVDDEDSSDAWARYTELAGRAGGEPTTVEPAGARPVRDDARP